ncbi:hypothetical protein CYLTODRAFT_447726 [Cylindrobasidium torrendii FP15055 ss-10]|uniref:Uncharacterized protein n=1 Tax=Cylindrobasidium torrendii FP15055 ss-10 TaxID=1314674 RepID=A0A0D7ATP7_9AGAR|nr:hypothetical protein CYLTODRAFT_447726 [Cylindrobasidium torrendii FP15055 ss-10]
MWKGLLAVLRCFPGHDFYNRYDDGYGQATDDEDDLVDSDWDGEFDSDGEEQQPASRVGDSGRNKKLRLDLETAFPRPDTPPSSPLTPLSDDDGPETAPEAVPPHVNAAAPAEPAGYKASQKKRSKRKRNQRRAEVQAALGTDEKAVHALRRAAMAPPLTVNYSIEKDAPVDASAFTAKRSPHPARAAEEKLLEDGYRLVDWDNDAGKWFCGACVPVVDRNSHFFVLLAGQPRDHASWEPVASGLGEEIERERQRVRWTARELDHNCGRAFPAPASGVSHCNGTKRPANRRQKRSVGCMMRSLSLSEPFRRLNGFVNTMLKAHNREMYDENERVLSALQERYPDIQRNFDGRTVFAAMTVNAGPQSVTRPTNQITGVTVFIPSALITHYNLPIAPGETRYSITQYSAGGLFRWVNNGFYFSTNSEVALTDPFRGHLRTFGGHSRTLEDTRGQTSQGHLKDISKTPRGHLEDKDTQGHLTDTHGHLKDSRTSRGQWTTEGRRPSYMSM